MRITYVPRSVWGASPATETYIRNRVSVPANLKTSIQIHHTTGIDNDPTPNRWDYDEAVRYMRRLETLRPDLGPLPYSENPCVSEDLSTVWIFEGRGPLKLGAHTGGHNRDGIGFGCLGNFGDDVASAVALVGAIESRCRILREDLTPNLGTLLNPRGWEAWGHRDSKQTTCPGSILYQLLASFHLDEGDDMGWTKPEDGPQAVQNLTDVDKVNEYQGYGVLKKADIAYDENSAANLDERLKIIEARLLSLIMDLDRRKADR